MKLYLSILSIIISVFLMVYTIYQLSTVINNDMYTTLVAIFIMIIYIFILNQLINKE